MIFKAKYPFHHIKKADDIHFGSFQETLVNPLLNLSAAVNTWAPPRAVRIALGAERQPG